MEESNPLVSIIITGCNEGKLLSQCLDSAKRLWVPEEATVEITYVAAAYEDDNTERARSAGIAVIEMEGEGFNAAKARNAGWQQAKGRFVLFLDGDSIVDSNFIITALSEFANEKVAVVSGISRQADPEGSFYNRALDLDSIGPTGIVAYCSGDAIIRRWLLAEVGGFDENLIAGEAADLCRRLRGRGYLVLSLDVPMVLHTLGIATFIQYWRCCYRKGYGYAELSQRYIATDDRLWLKRARYNILKGGALLLLLAASIVGGIVLKTVFAPIFYASFLVALAMKTALFVEAPTYDRMTLFAYGLHSHFQHIPIFFGQMGYWFDRLRRRKRAV